MGHWLGSMGLDVDDIDRIWGLVDNGDNAVSAEELTDGVAKLMGAAKSIDLITLVHDFAEFKRLSLTPTAVNPNGTCDDVSSARITSQETIRNESHAPACAILNERNSDRRYF